ncbi:hypothetical protein VTI74DRAFT_5428 [Chaetomium olivicolor]
MSYEDTVRILLRILAPNGLSLAAAILFLCFSLMLRDRMKSGYTNTTTGILDALRDKVVDAVVLLATISIPSLISCTIVAAYDGWLQQHCWLKLLHRVLHAVLASSLIGGWSILADQDYTNRQVYRSTKHLLPETTVYRDICPTDDNDNKIRPQHRRNDLNPQQSPRRQPRRGRPKNPPNQPAAAPKGKWRQRQRHIPAQTRTPQGPSQTPSPPQREESSSGNRSGHKGIRNRLRPIDNMSVDVYNANTGEYLDTFGPARPFHFDSNNNFGWLGRA